MSIATVSIKLPINFFLEYLLLIKKIKKARKKLKRRKNKNKKIKTKESNKINQRVAIIKLQVEEMAVNCKIKQVKKVKEAKCLKILRINSE